ncbi:MAG: hypothetical protein LC720_01340 [Actinobacteria bacterium]|nr:hypothetical protein [Actinomycetota bacterium]
MLVPGTVLGSLRVQDTPAARHLLGTAGVRRFVSVLPLRRLVRGPPYPALGTTEGIRRWVYPTWGSTATGPTIIVTRLVLVTRFLTLMTAATLAAADRRAGCAWFAPPPRPL